MEIRTLKQAFILFLVLLVICVIDQVFGNPSWILAYLTVLVGMSVLVMFIIQRRASRKRV